MLEYGKVTDTIYNRSVKKVIERTVPGASKKEIVRRDTSCFEGTACGRMKTASATVAGKHLAAEGAVHLAVNRLAAVGCQALLVNIQLIVPADIAEQDIKAMIGAAAACCAKFQITSIQADVTVAAGIVSPVVTATATGEAERIFTEEKPEADQDIIMAGYAGGFGAAQLAFEHQQALEQHFNPVFLSPVLERDDMGCVFSGISAVQAAAQAGVRTMYACGEGGVYTAVWELAEYAGLGARIQLKEVPLKQETVEICDYFNISPYQLLSIGAILMTATHGQKVLAELAAAGIPAVIIGHLTDDNDRVVINEDEVRFLEPFRQESLNQAKAIQ